MMIKRIKHISELPSWFQIKKYDGAKHLNAAGWYEQLYVRKNCVLLLDFLFKNNPEHTNEILELVRKNPIVDTSSNALLSVHFYGNALYELKPKKPFYSLGVHPMTMREFNFINQNITHDRREYLNRWWKQFDEKRFKTKIRYPGQAWIDEPVKESSIPNKKTSGAVCINLELPDNVLIEHFKQYLISQRSKINMSTAKRYRQPDFNDWIRFSILPYLDLQIWKQEANVSIPNRVMADAIYPKGEGGEETVRKTTASLAEQLLTDEQLSTLGAQAALEIAEQNHL